MVGYYLDMEPNQQLESSVPTPEVLEKKPKNPARKWLMVSGFGIMLCIISLGVHVLRGGSSNPEPLSKRS